MANMTTEKNTVPQQNPQVYSKIVFSSENFLLSRDKLEIPPSVVDGLDPNTEYDLRITGCEYIQNAGILLKLPQVNYIFQRVYLAINMKTQLMLYSSFVSKLASQ